MNNIGRTILVALTMLLAVGTHATAQDSLATTSDDALRQEMTTDAIKSQGKRVIVLNSYYMGYYWASMLESAVVTRFAVDKNWSVEVDYLDLVANRNAEFMKKQAEKIMNYYHPTKDNIVVLLGEEAWIMYRTYMKGIWKDVPCVALFSGSYTISAEDYGSGAEINDKMKISLNKSRQGLNATLITDPFFVEQTIGLAVQLRPNSEHLALVTDTWQIGYVVREIARKTLINKYPQLQLLDINNHKFDTKQLQDTLSHLPANTTVVFDSWFSQQTGTNRVLYPDNAMRLIVGSLTGDLVFGLFDQGIRGGTLAGGVYPTIDELSEKLVSVLNRIVAGEQPKNIPLLCVSDAKTYLNYNTLKEHHVAEELYPADAIYYGKSVGFLEENTSYILIAIILLIVLAIAVSVMAVYERRLKYLTRRELNIVQDNERGKTAFISNMGNIMRTPLHAISMGLDMFEVNHLSHDEKEYLKIIKDNKEQLLNIFNDIIDLGKADTHELRLEMGDIDLDSLLLDIKENLTRNYEIAMDLQTDGKLHMVKADIGRLSKVLNYGIINMDYHKAKGEVEVKMINAGGRVTVMIMASTHFTEKDQTELFDVFNTKLHPAESGRSNLEMPLCQRLVNAMGGNIMLQQKEDGRWALIIEMIPSVMTR